MLTCPQCSMLREPTSAGAGCRRAPNSQNVQKKASMAPAKIKLPSVARALRMTLARRRVRRYVMVMHLETMLSAGCGLGEEQSTSRERTRASMAVHCSAEC